MGNHEYCEDCGQNTFHNHRPCHPEDVARRKGISVERAQQLRVCQPLDQQANYREPPPVQLPTPAALAEQIQALRSEIVQTEDKLGRMQTLLKKLEWREHAEHCAAVVATWPEWKRNVLGQSLASSLSVKRPPVNQETATTRRPGEMTPEEVNALRNCLDAAEKLQRNCKQFDEAISSVRSETAAALAIRTAGGYPTQAVLAYARKTHAEDPTRPQLYPLLSFVGDEYLDGLAEELQQAVLDVLLRRRGILQEKLDALQYVPPKGE